jgi:hypothetical protein
MDARFVLNGITFVWDEKKARENPRRHSGVTFEQAAEAFFDPFLKMVNAGRRGELRDAVIGMDTRLNLLFVVYVEPEADALRIVSARRATRKERNDYEA